MSFLENKYIYILIFDFFAQKDREKETRGLCEILKAFKIIKNKNADLTGFLGPILLYTALFSQTAKK